MDVWTPFHIPAVELRRAVAEAAALGEAFEITYVDAGATVVARFDGGLVDCLADGVPCGPDAVVSQPPLTWWARKFLVYLPYPHLDDGSPELPCFGP